MLTGNTLWSVSQVYAGFCMADGQESALTCQFATFQSEAVDLEPENFSCIWLPECYATTSPDFPSVSQQLRTISRTRHTEKSAEDGASPQMPTATARGRNRLEGESHKMLRLLCCIFHDDLVHLPQNLRPAVLGAWRWKRTCASD